MTAYISVGNVFTVNILELPYTGTAICYNYSSHPTKKTFNSFSNKGYSVKQYTSHQNVKVLRSRVYIAAGTERLGQMFHGEPCDGDVLTELNDHEALIADKCPALPSNYTWL